MTDNHFRFSPRVLLLPFLFVLTLWLIYWAGWRYNRNLAEFGIYPRDVVGLRGIFLSPFIHGNIEHLYNNSIPLLILLAAISYFYSELSLKIIGYGIVFSGLITWIIGRESHHIGASGLIYVLVSFIFFKGVMTKYYRLIALSLCVVMLYGSMVWYVFPGIEEGISWEGHLGGFITGFAFAVRLKTPEYRKMIRYDWERPDYDASKDKFMQRFDKNGNFVNPPKPEPEPDVENSTTSHQITYTYIPREKAPD